MFSIILSTLCVTLAAIGLSLVCYSDRLGRSEDEDDQIMSAVVCLFGLFCAAVGGGIFVVWWLTLTAIKIWS